MALRTKLQEADMREEGLTRRMANFLRKVLPDYTMERQPKTEVHQSITQTDSVHGNTETRQQ
jgi:hypothetical protein